MFVVPQTMLNSNSLTVADVAILPENFWYELLDGRLVVTPPVSAMHQYFLMQTRMAVAAGRPRDVLAAHSLSVMVDDHNEARPDVVLVDARHAFRSPVPVDDVLLAVEVLTEESVVRDLKDKRRLYARGGIPSYWVVDPRGEHVSFTQFLLGDDDTYERHIETTDPVMVDVPWEITLDLPAWTRYRDGCRNRAES